MKRGLALVAMLMLLSICAMARAEEYKSPDGFSLSYPQGWVAISKTETPQQLPASVAEFIDKAKVDFNGTAVMFVRAGEGAFLEYAKVTSSNFMPLNDYTMTNLVGDSQERFQAQGMTADIWEANIRKFGNNKAIVLDYKVRSAISQYPLHVRQYYISKKKTTYLITCTAKWGSMGTYASAFEQMASSFKFPGE